MMLSLECSFSMQDFFKKPHAFLITARAKSFDHRILIEIYSYE